MWFAERIASVSPVMASQHKMLQKIVSEITLRFLSTVYSGFFMEGREVEILKPGQKADIIVDIDEEAERIDVRQSMIYDVVDRDVTFAQTSQPITERHVDSKVHLTVLRREQTRTARYGCEVRIREILRDYEIASRERVGAIVAILMGKPFECNLRMHYRLTPSLDSGLEYYVGVTRMSISDISLGGARFLLPDQLNYTVGAVINGRLVIDGIRHTCQGRVLRVWEQQHSQSSRRSDALWFMSVQFSPMKKETERQLSRKIREIERLLRQRELDLRVDREKND